MTLVVTNPAICSNVLAGRVDAACKLGEGRIYASVDHGNLDACTGGTLVVSRKCVVARSGVGRLILGIVEGA